MRNRVIVLAAVLSLLASVAGWGQAQRGSITVQVVSSSGDVIPGAIVSAQSGQTLTRRSGVTDANGSVDLVGLDPASDYVVTTDLEGFQSTRNVGVQVRAGQEFPLKVTLGDMSLSEELVITAEAPVVDVTSAITGQDITLQLTDSLPTGRSYQDYLQLVPGVMPAIDQGQGVNPASRSGLNYRDLLGELGQSRDNFYYLEGINVTDGVQGLSQTDINTEIIQEQSVLTGGLPAEFVGAPGLVSNVITKSGGNQFSGSVNYYAQNDSLVGSNDHFEDQTFNQFDAALTIGGPIVSDRMWFFGSYRNVNREDDVVDPEGNALRTVERDANQGFLKLSWSPTDADLLTGIYLSDPTDISGQSDNTLSNARDFTEERGAERYTFNYSRVFTSLYLDVAYSKHEGDLNQISAIQASYNDVIFRAVDNPTQAQTQLGGAGDNDFETRGTESFRGSVEYLFDTSFGDHSIKAGFDLPEYTDFRDQRYVNGERYNSLSANYVGQNITNADIIGGDFTATVFDASNPSDFDGFMNTVNSSPNRDAYYNLFDINGDGTISPEELVNNLIFNTTAGNPDGQINYERRFTLQDGAATTASEGTVFFLQDTWQWNRFTVNAGFRAEEWEHFASTGQSVFTFDTEYAPRLSVAYDLKGDGRSRVTGYYGRYYDPIRNNATNFVGSLTTREFEEQVYVEQTGEWVAYRTRGGVGQLDATFAPNTKTPYTDEYQLGYKTELGRNMSVEANLIYRETKDIIEDYDYGLYADPDIYPGDVNHPDSLFLGPEFFGFPQTPSSNFNIMTLPPGNFREWKGVELIFRKRYSDNWQALASYNYADAEGNTNSDSNFDFAGDVLWLDPRAPNMEGTQAGLIEHLLKVGGSYNWDNGFQIGGSFRWNSGAIVNTTAQAVRRNLQIRDEANSDFAGINARWVRSDAVGQLENPSYGVLDLRFAYLWDFSSDMTVDFFVDVFNVADDQTAVQIQDRESGGDGFAYKEGKRFVTPRRFYLGVRFRYR